MANPTTNYAFAMPTNTDLVKDLPADFEIFGQAVDTQIKTNADAAIAKTIVDAKGDLIAATGADAVTRVAVGTNGQYLKADSTASGGVSWDTLPSSGGMTLISTTTLSGATTTLSSIPQIYKSLYLVISGMTANTGNDQFKCLFNNVNNLSNTSGIKTSTVFRDDGLEIRFSNSDTLRTDANNAWVLQIDNYTSSTTYKPFNFYGFYTTSASGNESIIGGGGFRSNTAITSLVFNYGGAKTFAGGTVLLYGVA